VDAIDHWFHNPVTHRGVCPPRLNDAAGRIPYVSPVGVAKTVSCGQRASGVASVKCRTSHDLFVVQVVRMCKEVA